MLTISLTIIIYTLALQKNINTLTDTIINLETVNPIEFFGVNNGKLDLLKKKFPLLKILSRGTQIKF